MSESDRILVHENTDAMGLDTMLFQTQEECAELIKAISKFNRARGIGSPTNTTEVEAKEKLMLEIADVEICVQELQYLLRVNLDAIKSAQIQKVHDRLYGGAKTDVCKV